MKWKRKRRVGGAGENIQHYNLKCQSTVTQAKSSTLQEQLYQ